MSEHNPDHLAKDSADESTRDQDGHGLNINRLILDKLASIEKQLRRDREFYSPDEAAEFLGLSVATMYRLLENRAIPHSKPGGKKIYIEHAALIAYLKRNQIETLESVEQRVRIAARRSQPQRTTSVDNNLSPSKRKLSIPTLSDQ